MRHTHNSTAILLLNLFLGWTVIGWFVALMMAVCSRCPAAPITIVADGDRNEPLSSRIAGLPASALGAARLDCGRCCSLPRRPAWCSGRTRTSRVLFDLSYILNTAERIALGQMPYRDFPLAHAPLTFLIQAAIIRLTGRVFFHHVLYIAIVGGLGTVLTWSIALDTLRGRVAAAWTVALLVAAPLDFPRHLLHRAQPRVRLRLRLLDAGCGLAACSSSIETKSAACGFAAGAVLCVPLFFKQNMGLPFLACGDRRRSAGAGGQRRSARANDPAGHACRLERCSPSSPARAPRSWLPCSRCIGPPASGNYFHWTIEYAGAAPHAGTEPHARRL